MRLLVAKQENDFLRVDLVPNCGEDFLALQWLRKALEKRGEASGVKIEFKDTWPIPTQQPQNPNDQQQQMAYEMPSMHLTLNFKEDEDGKG